MCAVGFFAKREEKVEKKDEEKPDKEKEGELSEVDKMKEKFEKLKQEEKKLMDFGDNFFDFKFREHDVKCTDCQIDNCVYCSQKQDQVKQNKFITCSLCKPKYGLVDGRCETCPQNCRYFLVDH